MAISIGEDSLLLQQAANAASGTRADRLSASLSALSKGEATDEELMDACKSFETYLVEQVIKQTKDALTDDEDEKGDYMKYFGDNLTQAYAETIAENANLGIAQMLYESMKRE